MVGGGVYRKHIGDTIIIPLDSLQTSSLINLLDYI